MNTAVILRDFFIGVAIGAVLLSAAAFADQPSSIPRIGVLNPQTASESLEDALRNGLSQLGYVEGKNIKLEWRRAADTPDEMRALATDLVNSGVDLIVAMGSPATRAALDATAKPVVFLAGDPVASGFASSLARPGGNATGVSVVFTEMITKDLELLHELVPRARRIIYLTNSFNPGWPPAQKSLEHAAKKLGVRLVILDARNAAEMDAAVHAIPRSAADAVLVSGDLLALANRDKIAQAVRKARLPAMFPFKKYHEAGVLMSYGANYEVAMSQIGTYIDRILKGAKPSELPIEQVSRYDFVINLRVAREMGIEVPQALLLRADEVIR